MLGVWTPPKVRGFNFGCWLGYVLGEVGDGIFGWLGDVAGCEPPLSEAVRCEEAATAAAEGSRFEASAMGFPSGIDWGICVGELFFGVEPRNSLLVENLRDKPPLVFSCGTCDTMGDTTSS